MLHPGVQFKAIKRDALASNRNFGDPGANFCVEAIAIHPEVVRGVPKSDEARRNHWRAAGHV